MTDLPNGRPTWRDLTEAMKDLRAEMSSGFDRIERRLRFTITTLIAAGALAVAITAVALR